MSVQQADRYWLGIFVLLAMTVACGPKEAAQAPPQTQSPVSAPPKVVSPQTMAVADAGVVDPKPASEASPVPSTDPSSAGGEVSLPSRLQLIPGLVGNEYPLASSGNKTDLERTAHGWRLAYHVLPRNGTEGSYAGYCWEFTSVIDGRKYKNLVVEFSSYETTNVVDLEFKLEQRKNTITDIIRYQPGKVVRLALDGFAKARPEIARFCLNHSALVGQKKVPRADVTVGSVWLDPN